MNREGNTDDTNMLVTRHTKFTYVFSKAIHANRAPFSTARLAKAKDAVHCSRPAPHEQIAVSCARHRMRRALLYHVHVAGDQFFL